MPPKLTATLWRFAKVIFCEALAAALAALYSLIQTNGTDLGIDSQTMVLALTVLGPIFAATEKWLHWWETQPNATTPSNPPTSS